MECFLCEQDAVQECPRCGALYCDDHGEALCERCMDPALALPSFWVYRGSLLTLFVGSVFALWLLLRPPDGADLDSAAAAPDQPPPQIAATPVQLAPAAPTPATQATPSATPTPTAAATASATVTATPTSTAPATLTPTATATPEPAVREYTVEVGDTLILIAERFLPDGADLDTYVAELAAFNGIDDIALVQLGQVLQIPP